VVTSCQQTPKSHFCDFEFFSKMALFLVFFSNIELTLSFHWLKNLELVAHYSSFWEFCIALHTVHVYHFVGRVDFLLSHSLSITEKKTSGLLTLYEDGSLYEYKKSHHDRDKI
jgi:hypothetical protein